MNWIFLLIGLFVGINIGYVFSAIFFASSRGKDLNYSMTEAGTTEMRKDRSLPTT